MKEIIAEHKGFWKQIIMLAKNEIIKQYKGSVFGPIWALIKPTVTLFMYWFAFKIGIRASNDVHGLPLFIFMLVGFIPWFYMSENIIQGARCLRKNKQFVTKISFPVSTIMTYTALGHLFVNMGLTTIMYIIIIINGYTPSIYNLQFFIYCPLMVLFFIFLSWSTATIAAHSKDFENLINSIMTALFWMSGIIWDSYSLTNPILRAIMLLNPINFFTNGYRNAFVYNQWFFENPLEVIIFVIEFIGIFALGVFNYKRLRKTLPDVL